MSAAVKVPPISTLVLKVAIPVNVLNPLMFKFERVPNLVKDERVIPEPRVVLFSTVFEPILKT